MNEIKLPNGQILVLTGEYMKFSANWVVNQVFKDKEYTPEGFEIKKDDVIIDIGANIGIFSLLAAQQAHGGKVYAIEPTGVINCLELSAEKNALSNIKIMKVAMGADNEMLEMTTFPAFNILNHQKGVHQPWFTRFLVFLNINLFYRKILKYAKQITETVPTISLNTVIEQENIHKINLLKVDCEGAEYGIFRSLTDENYKKIDKISLEFHHFQKGVHYKELVDILESKGFNVRVSKKFYEYNFYKIGTLSATR